MNPRLFARESAVTLIAAAVSLAGKEFNFYKRDAQNKAVAIAAATDIPDGLILAASDDGLEISAAPFAGNHPPVKVKLGAAVTDLRKDLTLRADGTAEPDDQAGARVIVARPLETGLADEEIECVLFLKPILNPVALASTNGTAAAAADLAALKAETENIGDDVRALYTALKANGSLA
jgi:hypothetical protein